MSFIGRALGMAPKAAAAPALPPPVAAPPPVPTVAAPPVQAASQQLLDTEAQQYGRASTIMTSGQGVLGAPPTLRKTLLG